jgi:hypothetical protein
MEQEELIATITKVAARHQAAGCYCYLNYDEIALPAIWRWATSIRRNVPQDDRELRIRDLAKELTMAESGGRKIIDKSVLALAAEIAACMPPDPVETPSKKKPKGQ